ncbi:probable WRKY transcription factor 30 [Cajanus cajan]|uniref:WRKY transcription factor 30 n=1 Tax=Cajanus cajan TaxID=3821 RepID=A0A151TXZ0_CAJCA|nr:probable WRKY transcription factor 30 [Cajanus cajan]KYP71922.1 putative WRKY transcription factor 30 [Cajanus cajan]
MGESTKRKHTTLIHELIQGKELAKQLSNLMVSSSPLTNETNGLLVEKILSSYEKALTMLNKTNTMMDSNSSFTNGGSPRSEVVDHEFEHKAVFKKRKTMPRWTEQVKICSRTGLEGSLDDGYSWRKYGQKDILGAKFPRGYYRCTHRNVQGCLATKQVQRSDEDPTTIEVTYRGRHTCTHAKHLNKAYPSNIKMDLKENHFHNDQKNQTLQEKIQQTPEGIFTFETELKVKTEEMETKEDIFPWFCFSSPSFGSENEDNMLHESMIENHFMEIFSPAFISPATSESKPFCLPAYDLDSTGLLCQNIQTSESDITEILSAPTSVTNSPILDLDILLHKRDFDTEFPFNTLEFFSS